MQRNRDDSPCNGHFNSGDESPAAAEYEQHPVAGYEAEDCRFGTQDRSTHDGAGYGKKTSQLQPLETAILEK
jgi:hypothetical protein